MRAMRHRPLDDSRTKRIHLIFLLLFFYVVLLMVGEISLRIYHKVKFGIPFMMSPMTFYDKELGWQGRKAFGDVSSNRNRIFFVGDSFTHGYDVEEEDMYYSVVENNLDAEAYAYGGQGYSTLQEYFVIDKYLDEIKPDLIVLQVTSNDFINNSWELESSSFYNNPLLVRPYLISGNVEYRFPKFWGKCRMALSTYSRIFYSVSNRLDRLFAVLAGKGRLKTVEDIIEREGTNFKPFKKSIIVTDALVDTIKKRAAGTPIVAFSSDNVEPYTGIFRDIFKTHGIDFIESVYRAIEEAGAQGEDVILAHGHWDALGNQIVGRVLAEEIRKKGYLK